MNNKPKHPKYLKSFDSATKSARSQSLLGKNFLKLLNAALALGLLVGALDRPWGNLPSLAHSLSPFEGLWVRPQSPFAPGLKRDHFEIIGLRGKAEIQIDSDQVKHVFAENDEDLYFAQGWILAAERLWEMEFLTRVASGRLSEIVGPRGLPIDKMFLKMGLAEAASESAKLMRQDQTVAQALDAYSRGVNAYIASIEPNRLPFEYKLLNQKPEPWTPGKAGLLLKFMSFSLSGYSFDLPLSRSRAMLSKADFDSLFPINSNEPDPIIPNQIHWSFSAQGPNEPAKEFVPDLKSLEEHPISSSGANPSNGSNNWAVSGFKSTTGKPILSNDIHLALSLPSLWYEMQLVSPTQNVYGISLPGAPGVILGFNEKLAWGVTNGESDVLDWYQLRYRDSKKVEYLFDKIWRPVISREVSILVKGQPSVPITLRNTHLGPIVYEDSDTPPFNKRIPKGLAMHWTGLDASNELKTFLLLNHAANVNDCRAAIESYQNPSQNFLCADNSGSIALWHMGRFPVRWPGQGRMISDGSSSAYEWKGWVSKSEVPGIKNPLRGFLSSANQSPTDASYPHFLGWWYGPPFRGMRINELLSGKDKFSPDDLIQMQMDSLSIPARMVMPSLLKALQSVKDLNIEENQAVTELQSWDFKFTENSSAASIFHAWLGAAQKRMWSKYFPDPVDYIYPRLWLTLQLMINTPNSKWFDNPETVNVRETFHEVARLSLTDALTEIKTKLGTRKIRKWTWANFHPTKFEHLAKIPGLGSDEFPAAGVDTSILANQGHHGPVWKQVVALGQKPRAWGIYPGGQSGDPTSPYYDNFLEPWRYGRLKELSYLSSKNEHGPRYLKSISLSGTNEK